MMKRLVLHHFVALVVLAFDACVASSIGNGQSRVKKIPDKKTTEPPYTCLYPPINLPACQFGHEDDEKVEKSSRQRRALAQLEYSDTYEDPEDLSIVQIPKHSYSRALLIVYKIVGCLPPRLPFTIPLCKKQDYIGRTIDERKLLPFKNPVSSNEDASAPLLFPKLDMKVWNRSMQGPWIRPVNDEDDVEMKKSGLSEEQEEPAKIPKRKKFVSENASSKKKTHVKSIHHPNIEGFDAKNFPNFQVSSWKQETTSPLRKSNVNFSKIRRGTLNHQLLNDNDNEDEKLRRLVVEKISTNYHDEFPYRMAIPYDPAKLQMVSPGSEFPYATAIDYDPKKLEMRRDVDREFNTRRIKLLTTGSSNFRDVSFDASMLKPVKDDSEFSYGNEKSDETLKSYDIMEYPRSRVSDDINVPVRGMINRFNDRDKTYMERSKFTRKTRGIRADEEAKFRSNEENAKTNIRVLHDRKMAGSAIELSSKFSSRRWSKFPFATSFDPEKFRNPRSTIKHREVIPRFFPFSQAIPYNPRKLNAMRRRKSESSENLSINDDIKFVERPNSKT